MANDARLESLRRQHERLEAEIENVQSQASSDTLDIWTLKRKKLAIKEQIEALSALAAG